MQEVIGYSGLEQDGLFLEGTGAIVLEHIDRVAYAVRSDVYHTHVLMCIATDFAIELVI